MKLHKLELENFRRIAKATIHLESSTFIIGQNNTAKSSVIAAIEAVLSLEKDKLGQDDILSRPDGTRAAELSLTAYFGDISPEVAASRGFRGRVVNNEFIYRKKLTSDSTKVKIETQEYPSSLKSEYAKAKTHGELITAGIAAEIVKEAFGSDEAGKRLKADWHKSIPDALNFDTTAAPTWVENPGGIPQNVLSRLPRLIHIPALTETKELESDEKRYALGECLSLLFEDLLKDNPTAAKIQEGLTTLQGQMNPADDTSLVSGLIDGINKIVGDVFPECGITIVPSLQDLLAVLKPKYDIKVFSNIKTGFGRQGTGLVRTCAFAMLRYHAKLKLEKELQTRPVIVAFEEPELFLHPSAANLLRDTIYALGASDQIVCTTHSPWMIDLSNDPQSISRMQINADGWAETWNFGVSSELGKLPGDDKTRVKMVQVFDDELARIFFAEKVVVVEGDSEVTALRRTISLLPEGTRKSIYSRYQVVKARGKATIISLAKYLRALNVSFVVMHDSDTGTPGAEVFNAPIVEAVGDASRVVVLEPNLETALGYKPPSSDKPYKAYVHTASWVNSTAVPTAWRGAVEKLFAIEWPADPPAAQ